MSGFTNIVGFIFTFFLIIAVFAGIYVSFNKQILTQSDILENRKSEQEKKLEKYNIVLENYNYDNLEKSGTLKFDLKNTGYVDFYFRDSQTKRNCFNLFVNDHYINNSNIKITSPSFNSMNNKYLFITEDEILNFEISNLDDLNSENSLIFISCNSNKIQFNFYDNLSIIK